MNFRIFTILFFLLFSSILAQAQTTGGIAGTITDQNGAVIVGAEVIIISQATSEERTIITDTAGNFAFAFLAPGIYRVSIAAKGFNSFVAKTVFVSITETTTINPTLTVAGVVVDSIIKVNSDSPLIKTGNPTLGQV